jgi:hypothetical protein
VEEIMNTDELKHFTDPLLGGVSDAKNGQEKVRAQKQESVNNGRAKFIYVVPLAVVLGLLSYFLYQAQQQIGLLSDELTLNKDQLGEMTVNLEESQAEIANLNEGLELSKSQLASQKRAIGHYKTLYDGLKDEQQQQTRELEAIDLEKADRTEVNALKSETTQLQTKIATNEQSVADVRQVADQNRTQLNETQTRVASIEDSVTLNTNEIAGVKRSLEREYYNFELQEKGGYMKVFDVSLSLKDTDWKKRQFDMYLLADGKVLQKKDHSINEPIFFYIEGQKKPYEVVVTRVDKKLVVGYLSVPKG